MRKTVHAFRIRVNAVALFAWTSVVNGVNLPPLQFLEAVGIPADWENLQARITFVFML